MRHLAILLSMPDGNITRVWCKTRMSPSTVWSKIQKGDNIPVSDTNNGVTFEAAINPSFVVHVSDQGPA